MGRDYDEPPMALMEPEPVEVVVPLEERAERIAEVFDRAALAVGAELIEAKREHPGRFMAWVSESLPFGIDTAERLMAITRTFANADPEILASLPRARSALFALTRLPSDRLRQAVESGEVTPRTTYREALRLRDVAESEWEPVELPPPPESAAAEPRIAADIVAKELLRFSRSALSDDYAVRLRRWLG